MTQRDTQSGRLSKTEEDVGVILKQAPRPAEAPVKESPFGERRRAIFIVSCVLLDAIAVPWILVTIFGWLWVFVAPIVVIPLVFVQYKLNTTLFPPKRTARHVPSDHIPQFRAADSGDSVNETEN